MFLLKRKTSCLLFLFGFIFTLCVPLKGYCDNWVHIYSDHSIDYFYNKSNIDVNYTVNMIKVWVIIKNHYKAGNEQLTNNMLILLNINYNDNTFLISKSETYYPDGKVKEYNSHYPRWAKIEPKTNVAVISFKLGEIYDMHKR
jgi:hypothetical protein